ncbi:MAG: hypothetical protein V4581_09610 [Bacteroidota bacterium]
MSKIHVVQVTITNNTDSVFEYVNDWFDSGRVADGNSWPKKINPGQTVGITCYEKDWSMAGCSGWAQYKTNGAPVFFAFSNPTAGSNGIDIGNSTSVWDHMSGHYGAGIKKAVRLQNESSWLLADIKSCGGDINQAVYGLKSCNIDVVTPANIVINDVERTFNSVSSNGSRVYYKCDDAPTYITGVAESHFKGVAAFNDKLIFSHTNLDPVASTEYGKYMLADKIIYGDQSTINNTFETAHKGWHHPGGEQACGSFLAMGIQETADGGKDSEIQIYDIRKTQVNQPMQLIGNIKRNTGINGVAMTKEIGPDGKYIVAGINGNQLTIYKSQSANLLGDGASTDFDEVCQLSLDISGAGLALATQKDGSIYMFAFDADDAGTYNKMYLYKLNINDADKSVNRLGVRDMTIPGMSDSITNLQYYIAAIMIFSPIIGAALTVLLAKGTGYLNSSFRWGKGMAITSADNIEVYATDRNVLPLSRIPLIGSDKDFSVVKWR